VLFTANDAYMRDYHLIVPADCVASNDPADNRYALEQMRTVLKADVTPSEALDLEAVVDGAGKWEAGSGKQQASSGRH
jgi:nicotinamidase-related amidase